MGRLCEKRSLPVKGTGVSEEDGTCSLGRLCEKRSPSVKGIGVSEKDGASEPCI
jgi:hypothetical protein